MTIPRKPWSQDTTNPRDVLSWSGATVCTADHRDTAALIVAEHNAHEALVDACEMARDALSEEGLRNPGYIYYSSAFCCERIDAALAMAKGDAK